MTATATDPAGNTGSASLTLTIQNVASPPSPTPTPTPSPSPTPTASPSPLDWTSPEGTRITIESAGSWTVDRIYQMLVANGLTTQIGPTLTVRVQDTFPSQTVTGAVKLGDRYTSFSATMYLQGVNSTFADRPNAILGHEFGHVWTTFHLYLSRQGDWSSYLSARGLVSEARLDSSYSWDRGEIIADDYRLLFGSSSAVSEMPAHLNPDLPDPRNVAGLKDFFLTFLERPVCLS